MSDAASYQLILSGGATNTEAELSTGGAISQVDVPVMQHSTWTGYDDAIYHYITISYSQPVSFTGIEITAFTNTVTHNFTLEHIDEYEGSFDWIVWDGTYVVSLGDLAYQGWTHNFGTGSVTFSKTGDAYPVGHTSETITYTKNDNASMERAVPGITLVDLINLPVGRTILIEYTHSNNKVTVTDLTYSNQSYSYGYLYIYPITISGRYVFPLYPTGGSDTSYDCRRVVLDIDVTKFPTTDKNKTVTVASVNNTTQSFKYGVATSMTPYMTDQYSGTPIDSVIRIISAYGFKSFIAFDSTYYSIYVDYNSTTGQLHSYGYSSSGAYTQGVTITISTSGYYYLYFKAGMFAIIYATVSAINYIGRIWLQTVYNRVFPAVFKNDMSPNAPTKYLAYYLKNISQENIVPVIDIIVFNTQYINSIYIALATEGIGDGITSGVANAIPTSAGTSITFPTLYPGNAHGFWLKYTPTVNSNPTQTTGAVGFTVHL